MTEYRGFEGQVPAMSGLGWNGNMYNAQGNYDQARGPDGLSQVLPVNVTFGTKTAGGLPGGGITFTRKPMQRVVATDEGEGIVPLNVVYGTKTAGGLPGGPSGPIVYKPSRFGTACPVSCRPPRISGKPPPPPILDAAPFVPTLVRRTKIDAKRHRAAVISRRPKSLNKAAKIRQRTKFVNWLKNYAPQLYAAAKRKADLAEGGQLGELGGWFDSFTDSLKELGGTYLQYKTQKEILDAQLARMNAGLPPLETSQYAPTIAIKPDPGTVREITGAIGAGFGKMLPFIAIGGAALFLMMRRRPARG